MQVFNHTDFPESRRLTVEAQNPQFTEFNGRYESLDELRKALEGKRGYVDATTAHLRTLIELVTIDHSCVYIIGSQENGYSLAQMEPIAVLGKPSFIPLARLVLN
ncbi:MAG: hypothetical protein V1659_01480 [Candidatus Woesearchaeota archaeon]